MNRNDLVDEIRRVVGTGVDQSGQPSRKLRRHEYDEIVEFLDGTPSDGDLGQARERMMNRVATVHGVSWPREATAAPRSDELRLVLAAVWVQDIPKLQVQ